MKAYFLPVLYEDFEKEFERQYRTAIRTRSNLEIYGYTFLSKHTLRLGLLEDMDDTDDESIDEELEMLKDDGYIYDVYETFLDWYDEDEEAKQEFRERMNESV